MYTEVNDIKLFYTKDGEGSPLILLHGNGEDHSIFNELATRLKNHFTVYAIDSRNHGQSSKTDDYSYMTMSEDIYQFIEKQDLQEVSIIGFSDGAIIATMLELAYPGTLNKMVLLGINLKPSDFKPENIAYLEDEYKRSNDSLIKLMLEEPNIDLSSLAAIKTPTLVVRAGDELFKDELYTDICSTMPNAELLIMDGHTHDSYIVNTDILYDDLKRFLL